MFFVNDVAKRKRIMDCKDLGWRGIKPQFGLGMCIPASFDARTADSVMAIYGNPNLFPF